MYTHCRGSESADHFWIGLRDQTGEEDSCTCLFGAAACTICRRRFTWIDGTPVDESFENWAEDEPKTNERCVRLTNNGEWNGTPCSALLDYVCYRGKCTCKAVP